MEKEELIQEIKHLISVDKSATEINPKFLEYFTLEELEDMRDELLVKKENKNKFAEQYVEELSSKIVI